MTMRNSTNLEAARFNLSGCQRPVHGVGGDYFDVLSLDERRLGVVIGDVTGHDRQAAVPARAAQSVLHEQPELGADPQVVMAAMRHTLDACMERLLLMSCCYVLLDAGLGLLRYANAGHPRPFLLRRAGRSVEQLRATDPILGVHEPEHTAFGQVARPWMPGDILVLYTDGVSEARDSEGRMFHTGELERCVRAHAHEPARLIRQRLVDALWTHRDRRAMSDDFAIVVVNGEGAVRARGEARCERRWYWQCCCWPPIQDGPRPWITWSSRRRTRPSRTGSWRTSTRPSTRRDTAFSAASRA